MKLFESAPRNLFTYRNYCSISVDILPPGAVKTLKDLIFWQYSKIISKSAGFGKKNYGFIMSRFKKLQTGKMQWSGTITEWLKEKEKPGVCIYCETSEDLTIDHLIPSSRGGPDSGDNAVIACKSCNCSKGAKGVYEWFSLQERNKVPRIVEGKYLKLLFDLHEQKGTLDRGRKDLEELCEICTVGYLCKKSALSVYCLESIMMKVENGSGSCNE